MNSIQRVKAAISHDPVDKIPKGELVVDAEFIRNYMAWQEVPVPLPLSEAKETAVPVTRETEIKFYQSTGMDLVCVQNGRDEDVGDRSNADVMRFRRFTDVGLFVFSLINGAFQTVMCRREFMDFMGDVIRNPAGVAKAMQAVTMQIVRQMEQDLSAGAHGIIIADDIAYNQGPLVPPKFVTEHLLPCWQAQTAAAKELGMPVFFHSDGNLNALMPSIIDAGFDGLQCIEPAAGMDIGEIKRKNGDRFCLMGNMDPAILSVDHTELQSSGSKGLQKVSDATAALMSAAAPGGGFIFGTCSGLHGGMSPEKVHHMYELVDNAVINGPSAIRRR